MFSNKVNKCLETFAKKLFLAPCDEKNKNQKWKWRETYA
jgi:hypothetical protein